MRADVTVICRDLWFRFTAWALKFALLRRRILQNVNVVCTTINHDFHRVLVHFVALAL